MYQIIYPLIDSPLDVGQELIFKLPTLSLSHSSLRFWGMALQIHVFGVSSKILQLSPCNDPVKGFLILCPEMWTLNIGGQRVTQKHLTRPVTTIVIPGVSPCSPLWPIVCPPSASVSQMSAGLQVCPLSSHHQSRARKWKGPTWESQSPGCRLKPKWGQEEFSFQSPV